MNDKEKYFIKTVMCKACKYATNMAFHENTYMCDKHERLFMNGNFSCADGILVDNPKDITYEHYIPQSWAECLNLTSARNRKGEVDEHTD